MVENDIKFNLLLRKYLVCGHCPPYIAKMGSFHHVRGWLEIDFELVSQFKEIVRKFSNDYIKYGLNDQQVVNYQRGWHFPEKPINYINYVFYGAEMRNDDYAKDQIIAMIQLSDEIDGLFYFDYEGDYPMTWKILDSKITEESRAS